MRQRAWPAAALLLACWAGSVPAQQVEDAADAAPAAALPTGPIPALPAPRAAKHRLLGLAQAGTRLVAVGQQGVILTSLDGRHWRQADSPVSSMLTRVRFRGEQEGWAVGYDAAILHTTDGGQTWQLQHYDATARALYDILFLDAQRGIAVGAYGSYYRTLDGGKTWEAQQFPLAELGQHFNRLLRLADGMLFLAGERGLLARSTDDGASWQMLQSPYAGSFFGALALDNGRLLAYGMRGNIYVTDDLRRCPTQDPAKYDPYTAETVTDPATLAALGWRRIDSPTRESLFRAGRLGDGSVLLVGVNGIVLKADAMLGSVQAVKTPAEETLSDLMPYRGRLLAVGRRGVQDLGALP